MVGCGQETDVAAAARGEQAAKRSGVAHSCLSGTTRKAKAINPSPVSRRRGSSTFRPPGRDRDGTMRTGARRAPTVAIVRRVIGSRVHRIPLAARARKCPVPHSDYSRCPVWFNATMVYSPALAEALRRRGANEPSQAPPEIGAFNGGAIFASDLPGNHDRAFAVPALPGSCSAWRTSRDGRAGRAGKSSRITVRLKAEPRLPDARTLTAAVCADYPLHPAAPSRMHHFWGRAIPGHRHGGARHERPRHG